MYSAYGQQHSDKPLPSLSGYNGKMLDSATGCYLPGKGHRAYDPALMRFHSPDSLSPFGSSGLNPYGYCLNNPIILHDLIGHIASMRCSIRKLGKIITLPGLGE
ncbi:RHS repeat-associated core domain-containing protein [Pseudomonas ovata]|uniref:RHS repeat-associated core domain-containing protein n=1 Tax=Pseudomonas ovata TaxID=1839709 RepID=UPI001F4D77B8|nr:RHS repeat-associated core domain-containing protein [Pseudomonas ovata]